jgi:phosphatidylserine/phosphatidylglycerophosphate/cardiolipin synthase-like enzyme
MDFLNGRLQLFFGPREQGAADDLEAVILRFIDEAEHSLQLAVQEIDNPRIAAALDRAARRLQPGTTRRLRVRLITEGDYLCEERPIEPPDAVVSLDINRQLLTQLMRGAIDAKIDFNPKIFHQKFIIRDAERPRAAVLTGSANFTDTDTHRNLNHMAIFRHAGVVTAYQTEFDQLREGIFGARSPTLTSNNPFKFFIEGTEVQIAFSPDHNPELRIVNEILRAQQTAHLLMFTFAKSTTIDDALRARLQAGGFTVQGVLDGAQAAQAFSPHPELLAAGARLRRDRLPNQGKLHHKLLVLDDQVLIGGSFNYTGPANQYNDENLFIIRHAGVAQHARAEVDRIFSQLAADFG